LKAITLLNEKGGVGKTTLATHFAAGLTLRDLRVLLIDTDPQAHATTTFGLKKEPALHDLLVREAEFTDVLRAVPAERVTAPPDQPMPSPSAACAAQQRGNPRYPTTGQSTWIC
jgi:chromosome partitioning protein